MASIVDDSKLSNIQQTPCPLGAILVGTYGGDTDSLRIYEFKNRKFMHIIKKSNQRTFEFRDLPTEIIQRIRELEELTNRTKILNQRRSGWVNKI